MHELVGLAAVLLILAVAGGVAGGPIVPCCDTSIAIGPAVLVLR